MKNKNKGKDKDGKKIDLRPSVTSVYGRPATTMPYEVQPTADTQDPFPKIAQGLPDCEKGKKADRAGKGKNRRSTPSR